MSSSDDQARIMDELRARWGTERKPEGPNASDPRIAPFLEYVNVADDEDEAAFLDPSEEQMREFFAAIREARSHKDLHPLQDAPDGTPREMPTGPTRRELLAEIASEHYRRNVRSWMGGMTMEHQVTSTDIEDLERLLADATYRRKLMKVSLSMLEREIEALEDQVKAQHALAAVVSEK